MDRFERKALGYVLREDDPEEEGGGADPPKEEETPEAKPQNTIPIDVLPEELRGRSAAEIRFMLERMADSTASSGSQIRELRQRLAELEERNTPPPEPDPYEEVSDEELITQDPTAAIKRVLQREGLLARFDGLAGTVQETVFDSVKASIPDFDEHEENIVRMLKETNTPITRQNLMGAYTMSVGMKALKDRDRQSKEAANITRVTPEGDEGKEELPPLQGLEADIFEASGMSREAWESYKDDSSLDTIKVPR